MDPYTSDPENDDLTDLDRATDDKSENEQEIEDTKKRTTRPKVPAYSMESADLADSEESDLETSDEEDEHESSYDPEMDPWVSRTLRNMRQRVEHSLPQQEAPKPITFGENVNKKLLELQAMRQNSQSVADYKALEKTTAVLINTAKKAGERGIEVRFMLEQTKNAHIKKDFETAIDVAKLASDKCDLLPRDQGHQMKLICLFLMTSCYSNIGKLGSAVDILDKLKQVTGTIDNPIDKWKVHYNYGTHYIANLKQVGIPQPILRHEGEKSFLTARQAITTALTRGSTFGAQEQTFPLIMMAKILLDLPETSQGQGRDVVTTRNIKEAEEIINSIKSLMAVQQMDIRFKARLSITEAGLYFRKAQTKLRKLNKKQKRLNKTKKETEYIQEVNQHLNKALTTLDYAKAICLNTPYQEIQFATDFSEFLMKYTMENISPEIEGSQVLWTSDTEISSDSSAEKKEGHKVHFVKPTPETEVPKFDITFIREYEWKISTAEILDEQAIYFQEQYQKELLNIQQVFDGILKDPNCHLSNDDLQVLILPYVLLVRVAMDFPETEWGLNRFTVTIENLAKAEKWLTEIKRRMFLHNMCPMLKVYYLLAEASYKFRTGQMADHMTKEEKQEQIKKQKVTKRKQCFFDALFYLEHALKYLDKDIHGIGDGIRKMQETINKYQKDIFKL